MRVYKSNYSTDDFRISHIVMMLMILILLLLFFLANQLLDIRLYHQLYDAPTVTGHIIRTGQREQSSEVFTVYVFTLKEEKYYGRIESKSASGFPVGSAVKVSYLAERPRCHSPVSLIDRKIDSAWSAVYLLALLILGVLVGIGGYFTALHKGGIKHDD